MKKYAFFLDIDGTLASSRKDRRIPDGNIAAIRRAVESGHYVFINTGRSYANIPKLILEQLPFLTGVVSGNGSHIIINGKDAYTSFFDTQTLAEMCSFLCKRPNLWAIFEGNRHLYYKDDGIGTKDLSRFDGLVSDPHDFESRFPNPEIETIAVGPDCDELLAEFGETVSIYPMNGYCDCAVRGCTKAEGLRRACKLCGVPVENSVAVGDNGNDIPMLTAAGIAVAVENAVDEVKKCADIVTLSNDECGVAQVIEELCFSDKK